MSWISDILHTTSDAFSTVGAVIGKVGQIAWALVSGSATETATAISNGYDATVSFVGDQLEKAKEWMIQLIANVIEEIRVWKYKFRMALSKWMDNPLLFWLTIAGITAAVIAMPYIVTAIQQSATWLSLTSMFDTVKKWTGTFLAKIGYIQALSVHRIFLLVDPQYQAFWGDLDQAFMGLAEEVELGVGTFNNMTSAVRNLYYSTYTALGIDADTIEIRFYNDATKFWAKANQNWESYVRDPQKIFIDIQRELIYPILDEQANNGVDKARRDLEVAQSISDTIENINTVRNDFDALIESLPDVLKEAVFQHMGGFINTLDNFFDDHVKPFIDKLNGAIGIVSETTTGVAYAVYKNAIRHRTMGDSLISALYDGTLDDANKRLSLSMLFDRILHPDIQLHNDSDTTLMITDSRGEDDIPTRPSVTLPEVYKPVIVIPFSKIKGSAEGWFVGEY